MAERAAWARRLLREHDDPNLYFKHIIWKDVCNNVLPGGPQKAAEAVLHGKNKKRRLRSPGARTRSKDCGGTSPSQKQCGQGDRKVWFFVAMTRGHCTVHAFVD